MGGAGGAAPERRHRGLLLVALADLLVHPVAAKPYLPEDEDEAAVAAARACAVTALPVSTAAGAPASAAAGAAALADAGA